jgi:hypothetical protein
MGVVTERCRADGGEEDAIVLLLNIFSNGILEAALTRNMTREEADNHSSDALMQVYWVLLYEDEAGRVHCRLCAAGANKGGWKRHAALVLEGPLRTRKWLPNINMVNTGLLSWHRSLRAAQMKEN